MYNVDVDKAIKNVIEEAASYTYEDQMLDSLDNYRDKDQLDSQFGAYDYESYTGNYY